MKNKAKLGPDQNCWQFHEPTGRTCLRTSATRTAQLQMILYLQSLPSGVLQGEYDEGSQWHDVQASLRQKNKMLYSWS